MTDEKFCSKCSSCKPTALFYKNKSTADGFRSWCVECTLRQNRIYAESKRDVKNKSERERYISNKPKRLEQTKEYYLLKGKDKTLQKMYGISLNDYYEMLESQGGGCAICGRHYSNKRSSFLSVDHNHKSGRVRGLLCSRCNKALGLLNEDFTLLVNAIQYIYGGMPSDATQLG